MFLLAEICLPKQASRCKEKLTAVKLVQNSIGKPSCRAGVVLVLCKAIVAPQRAGFSEQLPMPSFETVRPSNDVSLLQFSSGIISMLYITSMHNDNYFVVHAGIVAPKVY